MPADDGTAVFATLQSVPRTAQAAWWGAQAGLAYKRIMSQYPDHEGQDCQAALSRTHQQLAEKLLQVCQSNGGVYIKAAQTFSTIQAVPKEYRKYVLYAWLSSLAIRLAGIGHSSLECASKCVTTFTDTGAPSWLHA